jgi:hypothetical protein
MAAIKAISLRDDGYLPSVSKHQVALSPLPAALVSRRLSGPGEFYEMRPLYECRRLQYQRVRNGGRSPEFVERGGSVLREICSGPARGPGPTPNPPSEPGPHGAATHLAADIPINRPCRCVSVPARIGHADYRDR